jgi:hypothetical protein
MTLFVSDRVSEVNASEKVRASLSAAVPPFKIVN